VLLAFPSAGRLPSTISAADCRATIKVRKPDNQDERVVALLAR
jgi:hypothetical protein